MRTLKGWGTRQIPASIVLACLISSNATASSWQAAHQHEPAASSCDSAQGENVEMASQNGPSETLPDSPGAMQASSASETQAHQQQPSGEQASGQQSSSQDQSQPQKPVGTAVAPPPPATGIAASEPAGAAIAPAKQRRVRTLLIRVGALVGAGVAIGTVVALSSASPSRPPGSH